MSPMYLIGVIAIAAMLVYVFWYQAQVRKAVAAGHGPIMFHNTYAGCFSTLAEGEYIIALWQGLAYIGSQSTAARIGGAVLNEIRSKTTGTTKYTPQVFVALTSNGRVLVAQEYSEGGQRGHYQEVCTWPTSASAVTGATAVPDHQGTPPKNPFNPALPLELTMLTGPDGNQYPCWLSAHSLEVTGQQRSVAAVLPMTAQDASMVWQGAVARAQ